MRSNRPTRRAWSALLLLVSLDVAAQPPDRDSWHARLHWSVDACPLQSPAPEQSGVSERPLARGASLIQVECERWAYQGTSLLYVHDASGDTPLTLAQFESPAPGTRSRYASPLVVGDISVDARGQTLRVLRKYRGIGDCGQYLAYRLAGRSAQLKTLRVRECPDEPAELSPEHWPRVKR
jgi:hypothetical protein